MSVSLLKSAPATVRVIPATVPTPAAVALLVALRASKAMAVVQVPMMSRHAHCAQGAGCVGAGCVHSTGKTYRKAHKGL